LVAKYARSVQGQFLDYHNALSNFGFNAQRFLISGSLQGLGGGMLAAVFGIYIKTAGMSERVVGDAEAALAAAAAVVSLLGTPLIARFGYRALMLGALLLMVGARLGMASFTAAGALIGFSIAVGLGDGFLRAVGSAFMSQNSHSEERGHLFSIDFLARVSASILGGLLGGYLPELLDGSMSEVASYQWTIAAAALIIALGIGPIMSLKEVERPKTSVMGAYRASFLMLTSWRRLLRVVGPQASIAMAGGMVVPFVPLYLKGELGIGMGHVGLILGVASAVTALGVFGIPVVARKLGLPAGVALLQGLTVPLLAAVGFAGSLQFAIVSLFVRGALMNMAGPLYNQLALEGLPDEDKPVLSGWMFFGLNMMCFLGNKIGGHLMEVSYTLPYSIAAILYAFGAVTTVVVWRAAVPESVRTPALRVLADAA
jgi:MFS family permease